MSAGNAAGRQCPEVISKLSAVPTARCWSADEVVDKILGHKEALGGFSRPFMVNVAFLPHVEMMRVIDAIGELVAPALRRQPIALANEHGSGA